MSGLAEHVSLALSELGMDYGELVAAYDSKREELVSMGMKGERACLPQLRPGDYFDDDGLLCSSNGDRRETAYDVDGTMVVFPLVDESEVPRAVLTDEQKKTLHDSRRSVCFQGALSAYRGCRFDGIMAPDTDRTALDACFAFRDDFANRAKSGYGMMLFGDYGTGKTHLAACICNAVIDMGYTARMTNATSITDKGAERWGGFTPYMEELCRNDLVVIDDLGSEHGDYMSAKVFEAIDFLYSNRVPVIVTTNMTINQIMRPNESARRAMERLKERNVVVEVKGPNRRQTKVVG